MKVKSKFSDLINEFTLLWLMWMREYNISIDATQTFKRRRKAGEMCESLIKQRYKIIEQINAFFPQ